MPLDESPVIEPPLMMNCAALPMASVPPDWIVMSPALSSVPPLTVTVELLATVNDPPVSTSTVPEFIWKFEAFAVNDPPLRMMSCPPFITSFDPLVSDIGPSIIRRPPESI